jgi:hypothetical protein
MQTCEPDLTGGQLCHEPPAGCRKQGCDRQQYTSKLFIIYWLRAPSIPTLNAYCIYIYYRFSQVPY